MKTKAFNQLLTIVPELNHSQRHVLRDELDNQGDFKLVCDLIEKRIEENYRCVYCHSEHIVKHGCRSDLIRYRCKTCGKTFNALTGTPFAHLRKKELWLANASCLLDSLTIRSTAKIIKVNSKTAFKWRHRNLISAHSHEPRILSGIVEADETFFRKSQKGSRHLKRKAHERGEAAPEHAPSREHVSVVVMCDRNDHEADYITGLGTVSTSWLDRFLTPHLDHDSLLITDGARAFKSFCGHQKISQQKIPAGKSGRAKGIYHIHHVNSYHSVLKGWMRHFHGVATKYLNHYLGWCHELTKLRISSPAELFKLAIRLKTPLTGT